MRSLLVGLCVCAGAFARAYAPVVSMDVRTADGQDHTIAAHESGLATLKVNGQEYGFRPTMWDDKGTHVTVTIFRLGADEAEVGSVDLHAGKAAVDAKTTPDFRVRLGKVTGNQS